MHRYTALLLGSFAVVVLAATDSISQQTGKCVSGVEIHDTLKQCKKPESGWGECVDDKCNVQKPAFQCIMTTGQPSAGYWQRRYVLYLGECVDPGTKCVKCQPYTDATGTYYFYCAEGLYYQLNVGGKCINPCDDVWRQWGKDDKCFGVMVSPVPAG